MIDPGSRQLLERWIYVPVKVGRAFLLAYTPLALARIEKEGGYGEGFMPFLQRFLSALQDPAWRPGSYYPGGLFRACSGSGADVADLAFTPELLQRFYQEAFRIETDGTWWVGSQQVMGAVRKFFLRHLEFDAEVARYRVRYPLEGGDEMRYLHHLSPPYRIERVDISRLMVQLNDGSREPLHPSSLRLDQQERLYCAVKPAGLPALFQDNPRWELLQRLEPKGKSWVLCPKAGESLSVRLNAPLSFPGGCGFA